MKNLITYLSKKSLSLGNGSGMTRKRLGNDSGMTRFSLASLICLCMLTIGSGNVWAVDLKTSDLDFGTPGKSENFNAVNTVSTTGKSGSTTTVTNYTTYGIFTHGYIGKSTSDGYAIKAAADPMTSKYLEITTTTKGAGMSFSHTFATKGAFSFTIAKTSKTFIGLYAAVANSTIYAKANSSVYLYFTGSKIQINSGSGWVDAVTDMSSLPNAFDVTVIYNNTTTADEYGDGVSIGAKRAHIFVNGTAVMNGSSPKEFTIPGTSLTAFRVMYNVAGTSKVDDIKVYDALPTAAGTSVSLSQAASSNGSFSLSTSSVTTTSSSGSVTVTCTPNDGYATSSVSATNPATNPSAITYGGSGNSRTVTYATGANGSSTISVTFACVTPTISSDLSTTQVNYALNAAATALSITASANNATLSYAWEKSANGTSGWTSVGTNSSSYTPSTAVAGDLYYRCTVTNTASGCSTTAISQVAHIHVNAGSTWKFKYSGDGYTAHTMTEATGIASYSLDLAADTRYEFGFDDNGSAFYKNQGTIITTTSGWVFNTSDNNCKIHTGPAGTYTFAINTTSKAVTVTYPTVSHPNDHYVYFKNTDSWGTVKGYLGNTGNDNKAAAWPGSDMQVTTEICGENYYYAALNAMSGTYNVIVFNNGSGSQTSDLSTTGSLGKFNANQDANWHDFKYSITFAGNGNTGGSMSPVSNICIGSNPTLASNGYTKTHYHFTGWIANVDVKIGGATVTAGTLIANAATIQDIHSNITLTAQWAPDEYTISTTLSHVTSSPAIPSSYTYTGSAAGLSYTISANAGYRLPDNVTVTGSTYSWNKNSGELTLTGTITGAVSITISGTQTHTVSWKSNGADYVSPVTYDHGAALALPAGTPSAPGGCSDKVFVGWTSDPEISTETSTKPTIISAGGAVTGGATYRAVFADQVGDPDHFKRVTQLSDIAEGGEIVFGFYVTSNTKLCGLDFSGWTTYSCATGVTETSSKIPVPSDANIWTVSKESGYWVFTNKGDGTTKLATSSSSSNNELDPETQTYYKWNIGASSSGTNNFYVQLYNGSSLTTCALELYSSVWKIYSPTGSTNYASNSYTALKLYVPAGSEDNYITLCSTCTTPSDVTASGITTDGATITWNGTSQENNGGSGTGFVVKYGTNSTRDANSNTINVAAGTNTADLTGLAQGTKYYVWVQSKCDNSWSTTPAEFTTLVSHTATFIGADGSTLQSSAIVEGESVTYSGSTPVSCDTGDGASTTFVGWATDTWEDKVAKGSIVPTFIDIAGGESLPAMSTSDVTYHAVFAKSSGTPLTNHAWTYTFTTQTFKSNGEKTLSGTEGGDAVDKAWTIEAMNATYMSAITTWGSVDADKGAKFGKSDATDRVSYMYITSTAFTGTVTNVKVSTSGASGTDAELSVSVNSASYQCSGNTSVSLTNSNTEYNFTGSQTIAGNTIQLYWFQNESNVALYLKKIEVDYTTGGDVSYSNYMTTCSQCVTPNSVTADAITEAGATINWAGTSKTGATGFTVLWGTDGTRANNSNSANVDADTKTYSITGLSAGTTYYVWVQSRCDGSWSDRISFTTKAIHTISFSADNGTISSGATIDIVNGETLTFPSVTSTTCGTFMGWTIGDYDNTAAPSPFYTAGAEMADITAPAAYKAVYRTASGAETLVTDNWTGAKTGVTTYDTWTKTDASAATYQGYTAKNNSYSNCIQMKSADSNSGIITTASGGDAKKVTITWNSNTTSGRTVDVYGKKAAYSSAADLYSAGTQGTKIGSIVYGTSTELEVDGDYQYIGLRSNSGALYIDNIAIQWYGSPMHYMTSPTCNPMVGITESLSSFTYAYGTGPSASQTFMVSGSNLGANTMTVTAPTNYEVSKDNSTFSSSVSYTPSDGSVAASTVYIRLAAGLSVGTYNYAQASGLVVACAGAGATAQKAALNGSVTKATGSIAFTDFNAGDHYEAEWTGSAILVPYNYILTGDGTLTTTRVDGRGGTVDTENKKWSLTNEGTYQLRLTLGNGTNYTGAGPVTADFVIYKADRFYDNLHGNDMILKRNDTGEDHYTIPTLTDESRLTSGSCSETHYHFMGWVPESALSTLSNDAAYDAVMITGGGTQAASGTNYYAVWAEE